MFYCAEEQEEEEEEEATLTTLPPELCQQLCQLMPSLSLLQLPLVSSTLGRLARKEMEARHERLDRSQMMIMTERDKPSNILNTIAMLCPGLVIFYDSEQSAENIPPLGQHTIFLPVDHPLFTTTTTSLSQCVLTRHLSTRSQPTCLSLTSDLQDSSPVLILTIPVDINHVRKVRNCSIWNTVHTSKNLTDVVGRTTVKHITLHPQQNKAQSTLAKEIIKENPDLDVRLYFNTNLQPPNIYEDLDTFLIVISDPNSDYFVQTMVERFLAKVFRPLKVCWIRLVN